MGINSVIVASIVAFVSTTVDDFVVIVYFMSRAEKRHMRAQSVDRINVHKSRMSRSKEYASIACGVFLGFTVLVLISLLGRAFTFLDMGYVCLLGLLPILLGVSQGAGYLKEIMHKRGHGEQYDAFIMKWLRCDGVFDWLWSCCGMCAILIDDDEEEDAGKSDDAHDIVDGDGAGMYAKVSHRDMDVSRSPHRQNEKDDDDASPVPAISGSVDVYIDADSNGNAKEEGTSSSSNRQVMGNGKVKGIMNKNEHCDIENPSDSDSSADVATIGNPILRVEEGGEGGATKVASTHNDDNDDEELGDPTTRRGDDEESVSDETAALEEAANETSPLKTAFKTICQWLLSPLVLEVALIMIGVGSDNVAIYMVIFATEPISEILLTIFIFYGLLAVNLVLAAWLMKCKSVALCFQEYAEGFVPLVLIGLGCFIVYDSVLFGHDGISGNNS